jgi:hypothetical protein
MKKLMVTTPSPPLADNPLPESQDINNLIARSLLEKSPQNSKRALGCSRDSLDLMAS